MSLSFSWGFTPKNDAKSTDQPQQLHQIPHTNKQKRRHADDDNSETSVSPARTPRTKKHADRFRISKSTQQQQQQPPVNKRSRAHVARILGQPLPTERVLEVLEKSQLEELIGELCHLHPEIALDISRCAPKPKVTSAIVILESKVQNIEASLPYKVDATSEYAYLRVKPLIEDFLAALSDYTLSFLPPVETVPATSLEFLDAATTLLHRLPQFEKMANNYFRDLAYEQLSHTWCICLKELASNGILGLVNNNWEAKINRHNEVSSGKLQAVVEMFKEEVKWLEEERESSPLKNFSINNSPCGLKTNVLGMNRHS